MSGLGFPYSFPFTMPRAAPYVPTYDGEPGGLEYSGDHCDDALNKLLEQYKGKPRIEAFLCALVDQIQDLEAAQWQLLDIRALDNAQGEQLKGIGRILGEEQGSFDEETFRALLRAKVRVLRSSGRFDDLVEVLFLVQGSETGVTLTERFPAAFEIQTTNALNASIGELARRFLRAAKGAAIRLQFLWSTYAPASSFAFSSTSSVQTSSARGFGDTANPATGGRLVSVQE